MKPTRGQIEKTIRAKHRLTDDQIALHKTCGFWYWVGDLPATSTGDNCTYYTNLSDVDLDRWVSDFESNVIPHTAAGRFPAHSTEQHHAFIKEY